MICGWAPLGGSRNSFNQPMNPQHFFQFLKSVSRKLMLFVTIYLFASMALFFAIRAIPGDPIALRLKTPDPVRVAMERERLGT